MLLLLVNGISTQKKKVRDCGLKSIPIFLNNIINFWGSVIFF